MSIEPEVRRFHGDALPAEMLVRSKFASKVWRSAMVWVLVCAVLGTAMALVSEGHNYDRGEVATIARYGDGRTLRKVGRSGVEAPRRWLAAEETDERSLLLEFKSLITRDPSAALNDWTNSSASACRWNAITCNLKGSVSVIDLSGFQLEGSISDALGKLPSLANLNLSHNNLSGGIPSNLLANAGSLISLDLSFNALNGSIPSLISAPRLATLNLHNNSFIGPIPSSLGNCSELVLLNLYFNQLSGQIPVELGSLVHLQALALSFNQLHGPIPTAIYTNCSNLTILAVSEMALTGVLPPEIGRLSNLVSLWMDGNQLSGHIPEEIGNLTFLHVLRISENNFTGAIPASIGNLVSLTLLLSLGSNQLTGPIPPEVGNLTSLQILTVKGNVLDGTIPTELGNLNNLQGLFLANNMFSGPIPVALAGCSKLQRLTLSSNLLVGSIPAALGDLHYLYELHLDRNSLEGTIPASFSNLTRLQDLSLGYNRLTGSLSTLATSASGSTNFSVPHNSFDGRIPSGLGNMIHVENIDLSSNNLSGGIPESLHNCVSLTELNLSFNSLNGTIPELGSLTLLQSLDLSGNHLSGPIPDFLSKLQQLVYLNLSFNNLAGQIPTTGVFARLNASSFLSNAGLCGHPSTRACPVASSKTSSSSSKSGLSVGLKVLVIISGILACMIFLLLLRYAWYVNRRITTSYLDQDTSPIFPPGENDQRFRVLKFTAQELEAATDNFSDNNIIGTGCVSKVYRARNLAIRIAPTVKKSDAAIKRLRTDYRSSLSVELKTLGVIRHRNLVELYGYCDEGDVQALVLEFLAKGSLQEHLYADGAFAMSLRLRVQIALNVAHGLAYLHHGLRQQIVHRDLKPCNVLLDENMVAKVADFGLAKLLGPETLYTALKGTPGYLAPESGETLRVTAKGDVYSFGVVVLELIARRKPTDDLFGKMGLTLPSWVRAAYPDMYREILDPSLREDSLELIGDKALKGILQVGLACSDSKPEKRPDMEMVVKMLAAIDSCLSSDAKGPPSPPSAYNLSNNVKYTLVQSKP